ncbi:MAG TPA: FdtA/QdtA family cupin domain-containing protein [Candidatus Rifleibacterium sp.]|nr:FdtA/QdtA family cupin domain-containing protein [Candidatus Rifleibacterium sp.]
MARIIKLPTFLTETGRLTVVEKLLPFDIKRIYYIYDVVGRRGGHRHKKTIQALVCLGGSCEIYVNNGAEEQLFVLDAPQKCLLVFPEDWHTMDKFSPGAILLVCASEFYDQGDYIDEEYR